MNEKALRTLSEALSRVNAWKDSYGEWETDESLEIPVDKEEEVFQELTDRMKGNYPFHHPVYAGQMLKPPHPYAWAAYALAMSVNPNNHALDGGPPSSEMEREVMGELAAFVGYGSEYLGHLTASGTIANLEALWVARESHPGKRIAYTENSHYTHSRMCGVLDVAGLEIPVNSLGHPELDRVDPEEIGTMVVTLGTTGLGEVEPLHEILPWARKHNIRVHVDAAYGGFFRLLKDSGIIAPEAWDSLGEADSIVIDPHKHGLQPYGCGAVLFKDPQVGQFYKHDSPYTYFTSDDLHLGEISLECSRAGAAAVALWATLKLLPLQDKEGLGAVLTKTRRAAIRLKQLLEEQELYLIYKAPQLDILGYFPVPDVLKTSEVSSLSEKVFRKGMGDRSFYLSLYRVSAKEFTRLHPEFTADSSQVTILRSVLMKPEQEDFAVELAGRLHAAVQDLK